MPVGGEFAVWDGVVVLLYLPPRVRAKRAAFDRACK